MLSTGVDDLRQAPTTWVYTNLLLSRLNFIRLPGDSRRRGQKSLSAQRQLTTLVDSPIKSTNLGRLGNRCARAREISFPHDNDYLSLARLKWRRPPRDATCHGSVKDCSRLFSKLMASDDVPVCSHRSWPWRAGSHAGSLRPVVLVAFTNVILTARRASRLSDCWLLSRLWVTTCHSERRQNNNYNINLVVKIVEGSRRIPGARDDPGLSLRSENNSWVANPMYTRPTESPWVRRDSSIYSFLGSGGGGGAGPWWNDGACVSHNYSSTWNSTHARLSTVPCTVQKPLHRTSQRSDQRKELWRTTSARSTVTYICTIWKAFNSQCKHSIILRHVFFKKWKMIAASEWKSIVSIDWCRIWLPSLFWPSFMGVGPLTPFTPSPSPRDLENTFHWNIT